MIEDKTVTFNAVAYTEKSLRAKSQEELLTLRNLVAENLGVARVKGFKDHEQAVSATWKALEKFASTSSDQLASSETKPAKTEKAEKPPKEKRHVKGADPAAVKRPTRAMFRKIQKIKDPDRVKDRWDNYKDGMTILETIEGAGMTPLDIYFYADNGFVKLIEPTDEEFNSGVDAWYKRNNLENPANSKKKRDEERAQKAEEAKAKKEQEKKDKAEAKAKKEQEKKNKASAESEKTAA